MKITEELMKVWNALVDWGFKPTLSASMEVEITVRNSSQDLNFSAAMSDFIFSGKMSDFVYFIDMDEGEYRYVINGVKIVVYDPRLLD